MAMINPSKWRPWRDRRGVAVLETAMVMPFLLVIISAGIDTGRAISQSIELTHAVRAGGQYSMTASNAEAQIRAAVRNALPATFRDVTTINMDCYCGVVPDQGTAMPTKQNSCDLSCPTGSARMMRIRASHAFTTYTPGLSATVKSALNIDTVEANVTVRHQ